MWDLKGEYKAGRETGEAVTVRLADSDGSPTVRWMPSTLMDCVFHNSYQRELKIPPRNTIVVAEKHVKYPDFVIIQGTHIWIITLS